MSYDRLSSKYHPLLEQFSEQLQNRSLLELEALSPGEIKSLICRTKLPSMIVPEQFGGLGIPLTDALDVVHFVGSKCPSAALMLCMHFHVVSTIAMYPQAFSFSKPLLSDIAENNKLMASAFAESGAEQDIFHTSVLAKELDSCIAVSGNKKPCSMSSIADYFAVSVATEESVPGIAIIKGDSEGVSSKAFWPGDILKGTDSNQVIFSDVLVGYDWAVFGEDESFEMYLNSGLVAFNLLIGAAYTGVAQTLSEQLDHQVLNKASIFIPVNGQLALCHYSVKGLADKLLPENLEWLVPTTLCLRFQIQKTLKELKSQIFECLGAHNYLSNEQVHYLAKTVDLLAFHPVTKYGFEKQLLKQ
jgi:hypothetical protein